jgi:hypothetical protein
MADLDSMAKDAFVSAAIGECRNLLDPANELWTLEAFQKKVRDDFRVYDTPERAQGHYDRCVDQDDPERRGSDVNKVWHFAAKVVMDKRCGWR